MSENDFIIIDEEKETPVTTEGKESSDTEKKEVFQTSAKEEHEDEYEKICFICHRPESVTGKMIDLPNHITVCPDCMQKSFDMMNNNKFDLSASFGIVELPVDYKVIVLQYFSNFDAISV